MKFYNLALVSLLGISAAQAQTIPPHALSLREALDLSQAYSPGLKAAKSQENAAESNIGIAQSAYYPMIEAQALDSTGFPGSTSYLGIGGLMGSPFRSGLGAGVVLTQTLYDFGRTHYAVKSTEQDAERQKQDTELTRYQVSNEVIQAYFDCVLNQSEIETWQSLQEDANVVAKEVDRFVRTGQKSIVDRYLAQTQLEETVTAIADFQTRENVSIARLKVILGSNTPFTCPSLNFFGNKTGSEKLDLSISSSQNPFIARAEADLKSTQALLDQAKSDRLPYLIGMGSAGYLQDERLVNQSNYSLAIGISIPLFEGFRITDRIDRNAALVEEKNYAVSANHQMLDDLNQQYNQTLLSSSTRLDHLAGELDLANKAFEVAKKRYFAFQGDLLDVRTALSNLMRVLLDKNTTYAQYLQSEGLKSVLNGAH